MSRESSGGGLIHEAKWKIGFQPLVTPRRYNIGVRVPKDPGVSWRREFAKDTHPYSAVIASPVAEFERIAEFYGDHLVPAIGFDVRIGGVIPKRIMATLIDETFQELTHNGGPLSFGFACRMGPHPFVARLGAHDPDLNVFHTPETTQLVDIFVPNEDVGPMYGVKIY